MRTSQMHMYAGHPAVNMHATRATGSHLVEVMNLLKTRSSSTCCTHQQVQLNHMLKCWDDMVHQCACTDLTASITS
jgi:hypothetical protein